MADYLRRNDYARVINNGYIGRVEDQGSLGNRGNVLIRFASGVSLWFRYTELERYEEA